MDNLRNQVADTDVVKFDKLICDSKQSALNAIQSHKGKVYWIRVNVILYLDKTSHCL